jgi:hypothetical protein
MSSPLLLGRQLQKMAAQDASGAALRCLKIGSNFWRGRLARKIGSFIGLRLQSSHRTGAGQFATTAQMAARPARPNGSSRWLKVRSDRVAA